MFLRQVNHRLIAQLHIRRPLLGGGEGGFRGGFDFLLG